MQRASKKGSNKDSNAQTSFTDIWLDHSQTSKMYWLCRVCVAHIFVQGLQGLQVNYCVVQVQDGLKQ